MKIVNFKLKISIFLLIFLPLGFHISKPASASPNFTTDYQVVYDVQDTGITKTDITISLTNKTVKNFVTDYQMILGFDDISNFKSSDVEGDIKPKLEKTSKGYSVSLPLNRKAVGLGSKNSFKISFDTKSIARQGGDIWEINIPGISNPSEFNNFTVEVKHPASFGKPSYIKPDFGKQSLIFDKNTLGKSGISIGFGGEQKYHFDLVYHIKNPNLFPTKSTIALPSDNSSQRIFIKDINPKPNSITVDRDGNWIAEYSLSPAQRKDITVKGNSIVQLVPNSSQLTTDEEKLYTKPTKFWQSDDPEIKKLSEEHKTPEEIYNFVVKTLKYDFKRVSENKSRMGALNALTNPYSAVCREYTDLFIAIARAAGIPTREINGFAHTENSNERPLSLVQDVLHSWPEYYDSEKKAWIMIDPTWGATTGGVDYFNILDFDHFAFVTKGVSDSSPIPAGGYKSEKEQNSKDVKVTFSKESFDQTEKASLTASISGQNIAGLPIKIKIEIKNEGPGALLPQSFRVSSKDLSPKEQETRTPLIPPMGKHIVEVKFNPTNILTKKATAFTMRFADNTIEKNINIIPFFLIPWN